MSSDRSNPYGSGSPTGRRKLAEKPPFKLCFSRDRQPGKSDVSNFKVHGNVVTPKFYSRETNNVENIDIDISGTLERIANEEKKASGDGYRWPLLTSHTYGWWHEKGIRPKDPRFNFHKKTSDLVNFQMKIYAEDRKLSVLKH